MRRLDVGAIADLTARASLGALSGSRALRRHAFVTLAPRSSDVVIHVSPDATGATVLTLPSDARAVRIVGPDVAILELEAGAALRRLDLRECGFSGELRVNLRCTSPLERLQLPVSRGSRLTLSLTQHATRAREVAHESQQPATAFVPLQIVGRIHAFNLAWRDPGEGGSDTVRALAWRMRRKRHLDGLNLGPFDAPPPAHIDGWIVTGGDLPSPDFGPPPSHLWIVAARAPRGLVLDGALDWLEVIDSELPRLHFAHCGRLRISPVRDLARITGNVDQLLLRRSTLLDELTLEGTVKSADLIDVRCRRLRLFGCRSLHLENAPHVERIETLSAGETLDLVTRGSSPNVEGQFRQRVERPTPREIDEQFDRGGRMGRDAMLGWAAQVRAPADLETALRVMCAAVDSEHATALEAWRLRSELHDGLVPPFTQGDWAWPFPSDQAQSGHEVDLFLWLRLLTECPRRAREAAATLTARGTPENIASLVSVAGRDDVDPVERQHLLELARTAMDHGTSFAEHLRDATGFTNAIWLHWRWSDRKRKKRGIHLPKATAVARYLPSVDDLGWVETTLHALMPLTADPHAARVASSFAAWLAMCLPWEPGLRALGKLRAHGCRSALAGLERVRASLQDDALLDMMERSRLLALLTEQYLLPDASPRFVPHRARSRRPQRAQPALARAD
ncbi:MAG: hypothetical protein FJ096_18220 [Deltaproteobacteria bacterium]|nr:hypothetical protein [Deltaproteobacteria bacterium]